MSEKLVSTARIEEGLRELREASEADAPYLPEYARKRDERMLLEFRRILRDAEVEYVTTGRAAQLTGWDAQTIRKYARAAVDGEALPEIWQEIVAKRDGKEYAVLLSTLPVKPQPARAA